MLIASREDIEALCSSPLYLTLGNLRDVKIKVNCQIMQITDFSLFGLNRHMLGNNELGKNYVLL